MRFLKTLTMGTFKANTPLGKWAAFLPICDWRQKRLNKSCCKVGDRIRLEKTAPAGCVFLLPVGLWVCQHNKWHFSVPVWQCILRSATLLSGPFNYHQIPLAKRTVISVSLWHGQWVSVSLWYRSQTCQFYFTLTTANLSSCLHKRRH